ncbi:nitroreductase family deazaflavin-dependent oxidoreductase [Micromonospora sp. CA-259024]|uniref:nitroreductase family deazaflavin-dependent oxidoreductase n=1 Tax=Micromonospora sp. CA-259024 TaxID=3239965 RepID=UPI003D928107
MAVITPRNRVRNRIVIALHRIGLPIGPMALLTVAGRRSGRPRTTPVAPVVIAGSRYLVEAYPGSDWVRNARAAGRGTLTRGRQRQEVDLTEVPSADRGPILREFPTQNPRGAGAFVRNGIVESPTPEAFAQAASRCPVFRATPRRADPA